jgi:hypothetical protein
VKRPRRDKMKPQRPPAPRIDATTDRAEQRLFEEAFAEPLWRRSTPL